MTVQERFRRRRGGGLPTVKTAGAARRPSVSVSLPRRVGPGELLVAVVAVATLAAVAVLASTGMLEVTLVAVGVGLSVWGWQRVRSCRAADVGHDELVRLWSPQAAPSEVLPAQQTLATLLAPEGGLTKLEGRDEERAELLRWCTDPAAVPVRVLAGVSGVGKSRLAIDVTRALPEGWTAGIVRPGMTAPIIPAVVSAGTSVLVVVDDADTEPAADIAALIRHAAGADRRVQVRVLLVVRDADTFGTVLDEHVPAGTWEPTKLQVFGGDADRRRFFAQAVRDFRGLSDEEPMPAWAMPECGPVGADDEPMAVTQMRAALAVLTDDPAMRTADREQLADGIRTVERQRWSSDTLEPEAQEEAVVALLLRGPQGMDDAVSALRTLPRFRDDDEDAVRAVATWARLRYPAVGDDENADGPWLDARPALLRGALLVSAVDRHPAHVAAALEADPQAFLRIARDVVDHPRTAALLRTLLTDAGLVAVIEVAVLTNALSLRDDLVEALTDRSLPDVERLLPITEAPLWSPLRVALRRAQVRHLREQAQDGPADEHRPRLACALTGLACTLREAGAHGDALVPIREAVELSRDLAAAHPDRHTPDLAAALTGLGVSLRELRADDEAVTVTREAVQLYRDLAATHPDPHLPDLARSLIDLGAVLRAAGAHDEALTAGREAVQRCRELAATSPARHLPDLAAALAGVGVDLRETGAHDEALTVTREAVQLYRDVAANAADRHSPDLARALTDLGAVLLAVGAHEDALAAGREAMRRYRDLTAARRDRHLPDVARALTVLGAGLRETGAHRPALATGHDAVRLHRELAAADPVRHTAGLARALTDLGVGLRGVGSPDDGLAPGVEAVRLHRELAAADPVRHTPALARALTDLGISLRAWAAHDDALAATGEAVELGRELAVADPARHTPELVRSLISLGAGLRALGRRPEAVLHEGEAVAWWWQLTQRRPGEFDEHYRDAQRRYFRTFSLYDHEADDLLTAELIARGRVLSYVEGAV